MKNKHISLVWCTVACLLLVSCGSGEEASELQNSQKQIKLDRGPDTGTGVALKNGDTDTEIEGEILPTEPWYGVQIDSQCFDVNLKPLGDVHFVSYEPDADKILFQDACFVIETDKNEHDKDIILPGWTDDNIRENFKFDNVQAVSFPDIESDGYDDIIIICDYQVMEGNTEKGSYTEVRIYFGSADGTFTLNWEVSDDVNDALAEKTISSVKDFLGIGRTDVLASAEPWQQMYIEYLNDNADYGEGYTLIYLDDDNVPELVQVGSAEAAGSKIISVSDGKIQETQLERRRFTYLERERLLCNSEGNMDYYYDIVWQMKNGQMCQISSGWWGWNDNTPLSFDEEGSPIYQYIWEGQEMPKEEYMAMLDSVFDRTHEKNYDYESLDSRGEMVERLKKM